MTKLQAEIIERIKKFGGEVVALNNGLYSRGGSYIAFTSSSQSNQTAARDAFLAKFCEPFTEEETAKVLELKRKRLEKYKWLINTSVYRNNFLAVEKLATDASYLHTYLSGNPFYTEKYFRLKGDL